MLSLNLSPSGAPRKKGGAWLVSFFPTAGMILVPMLAQHQSFVFVRPKLTLASFPPEENIWFLEQWRIHGILAMIRPAHYVTFIMWNARVIPYFLSSVRSSLITII